MSQQSALMAAFPNWRRSLRLAGRAASIGFLFIFLFLLFSGTGYASDLRSPVAQPATPDLIDQAYQAGAITADERLLYLAYAIYAPASLPAEYVSSTPWLGTAAVAELNSALAQGSAASAASISAATQIELTRLMRSAAATVCDQEDPANSLDSANFHINFGAIGGGLTAQNYADSLETTFGVQVTGYGWAKPPYCAANHPNCPAANPWGKYPVQVADLGAGLYGYVTTPGGNFTGLVGDNPNTAATETEALASCMVLNSNYSGFPGGAQFSLDVTTAHEFVHSIQFGYGDPDGREDGMWYESGAAYMEDEVFDDVNDNYQYLWPAFDRCLGEYKPTQGTPSVYSNWLFFRFAAERNGGTNLAGGGEEVMQQFWTNVAAGQGSLRAYDNALQTKGVNLSDTFHDYAIASSVMSACPASSPYCFEEAAGYVTAVGAIPPTGQIAAVGGFHQGSLANHFAANWVALPVGVAFSAKLENNSSQGQLRASIVAVTNAGVTITPWPNMVSGNQSATLPAYQPPAGATAVLAVITNQEWTSDNPDTCSAASYRLQLNAASTVAVDVQAPVDQQVKAGESVVHSFGLTNSGLNSGDFTLQATSSLGWADLTSVPSTVTIASGATVMVDITVTVPANAAIGQMEVTTLYAESIDNAAVNDTASVKTLPPGGQVHLPIVSKPAPPPPPPDTFYAVDDTTVLQGYPDDNTCNTTDMWAGYDDGALNPDGEIVRSLVRFNLSALSPGVAINGATLHLRHVNSWDFPNRTRTITVYGIASDWSACSATWSNQPSIGSAYGSQDVTSTPGQSYTFDVTELVRGWINGSIPNFGVEIRGPEASGQDSAWRGFATVNSQNDPYLTIDYATAAARAPSLPAYAPLATDVSLSSSPPAGGALTLGGALGLGGEEAQKCHSGTGRAEKCRASR